MAYCTIAARPTTMATGINASAAKSITAIMRAERNAPNRAPGGRAAMRAAPKGVGSTLARIASVQWRTLDR